jgi:hypothetical protein
VPSEPPPSRKSLVGPRCSRPGGLRDPRGPDSLLQGRVVDRVVAQRHDHRPQRQAPRGRGGRVGGQLGHADGRVDDAGEPVAAQDARALLDPAHPRVLVRIGHHRAHERDRRVLDEQPRRGSARVAVDAPARGSGVDASIPARRRADVFTIASCPLRSSRTGRPGAAASSSAARGNRPSASPPGSNPASASTQPSLGLSAQKVRMRSWICPSHRSALRVRRPGRPT